LPSILEVAISYCCVSATLQPLISARFILFLQTESLKAIATSDTPHDNRTVSQLHFFHSAAFLLSLEHPRISSLSELEEVNLSQASFIIDRQPDITVGPVVSYFPPR